MISIHPFFPFLAAALLALVLRGGLRSAVMLTAPLLGGLNLWHMQEGITQTLPFLNYELIPFQTDRLSMLFGYLFHTAAFLAIIFSLHLRDTMQHVAGLLYAGCAMGAVFAGDLLTLFVFWEGMALSSVFLIWAQRTDRAARAGLRYLVIQVLSGLLLLAGTIMILRATGTLAFTHIGLESMAGWLIFLAFGIKAAFPFAHNWLTDAYPEATATGAVFLSAFTTKVAVYALARGFAGEEILIYIGAVMTCFPIFYAVIENDLRRVLAYSMINQIGFMVCGIGIGTALAVNGAVAHAFNDVIFKGLLFMSMGAVLHMTGRIKASEIGGLYKTMPVTTVLCIIGAASISAFPLFSGFVSKSMILAAVLQEGHDWIWAVLLFASAGVLHHAGIKIPHCAFFAHDSGLRPADPPRNMLLAMGISAVLCIAIGSYPLALYGLLPFDISYSAYDTTHVLTQLQMLFFAGLAFVWMHTKKLETPELRAVNIDAEWLYRKALPCTADMLLKIFKPLKGFLYDKSVSGLGKAVILLRRHHGPPEIRPLDTWPISNMVMWSITLLGLYLVFHYL